jgi:ParB family chromosome partitioning protein
MTAPGHLQIEMRDPRSLVPAPWNPTRTDPSDDQKLDAVIQRHDFFRPIICRELPGGVLQILGGHQRTTAAIRLGYAEVPVVNLGEINESRAREITLIDNGRYGRDDAGALAALIEELGASSAELAHFLPFDLAELEAITASASIDLDSLGLDEDDAPQAEKPPRSAKTHEVMRVKVAMEDAEKVRLALKTVMVDQGFSEADELTNAGDALVWLVGNWIKLRGDV